MELLRVVAMLFVLIVHADYASLGKVTAAEVSQAPWTAGAKALAEALAVGCVDIFVMISGWFAIRASWRGLANYLFQILFFYVGIWLTAVVMQWCGCSVPELRRLWLFNWFLSCYLGLWIVSPLLNLFVERMPKRAMGLFLLLFFVAQTAVDWSGVAPFTQRGYSVFSFIGLYLLARWLRLWHADLDSCGLWLTIFAASTLTIAALEMLSPADLWYAYNCPLVIVSATALVMSFSKMPLPHSRVINFFGASCFAVLLFQTNTWMWGYYAAWMRGIQHQYSGLAFWGMAAAYIAAWFLTAILLDQPRRFLWTRLSRLIPSAPLFNA